MRMKRILLFLSGLVALTAADAQDIPLFSQKLTNSFMYNPAVAGHTFGSITFSYKDSYRGVEGGPENYFLSIHTPVANHRFGIGASVYQQTNTVLTSTYASGAFAYHIPLNKLTTLSMGVSAEYNTFRAGDLNFTSAPDSEYEAYASGQKEIDYSFGVHFQNRFLKAGIASNRLSTTWQQLENNSAETGEEKATVLSNYYSSFVQGLIPMRSSQDMLEPYFAYRKLSNVSDIIDLGVFYTFDNKLIGGVSARTGMNASQAKVLSGTVGFRVSKYLMVGYSRETILGNQAGFLGAANEVSLRFDFKENNYKKRFSSDYKSSVAYRRKTMSGPAGKVASRNPKSVKKKQKKLAPFSPNSRYQNVKKLSVRKSSRSKGAPSLSKKRKKSNSYKRKAKRRR